MTATYRANYRGIGEMLHSLGMAAAMGTYAAKVAARAAATAPVGNDGTGGHYASSFGARVEQRPERWVGIAYNDDPGALSIEFGTGRGTRTPKHLTLTRALVEH